MKIQQLLLEMMGELDNPKPGHVNSFAILFFHPGESFHKIPIEDFSNPNSSSTLLNVYCFTTEKALTETIGAMYKDFLDSIGQDRTEIPDMHSDPEIQKKLAARMGKQKDPKDMSLEELKKLPDWSYFSESFTIVNCL